MTRTFVLGRPADWQRDIYELVPRRRRPGRAALRIGRRGADVDAAARDVIAEAGYGPSSSGTGSATASGWRSTKRRESARSAPVHCLPDGGHRRARCLPSRARRRPHRGHARRAGEGAEPELLTQSPKDLTVL